MKYGITEEHSQVEEHILMLRFIKIKGNSIEKDVFLES